ncbi:LIM-domain binding protein-domain-containing protein [Neurospora tetraspora]|uniref:LIM-domain binding protein-domain-containing protein n=1 Tax=Neurospora tetraspora TaxID=94610 RepID=A0AAE0MT90_9PEZI|nr:LIM-domain binding protein-domain-containing protein [Neurospora tetraspora]
MQQQQQQQQQLQQQQQQQMAQQGNNPGQHPINPQGPGLNMQAQLAALHTQQAHAQQSAAVQAAQAQAQAQQGGPGQPQQQQQQPQAQPPQQPPQQQPGQPQQPNQQQPQVQPGPGVNGPAQNQGPAQGPTQQPNAQQQVSPQTPQTTQAQQAQLAHAQVQAAANVASLLQQKRVDSANLKGQCLLKLNLFNEHLNGFTGSQGADGLKYWHHFVQRFFSQKGVFRQTFKKREDEAADPKPYEIDYAALPRFFNVHFESGVSKMQLVTQGTTDRSMPHDGHFIEIAKASVFYWYDNGSHVVHNGTLRIQFDSDQNIELFDFVVENHEEYHSRRAIIEAARPSHTWIKEWRSLNPPDSKQSPEMSKKGKQRPYKSPATPPPDIELPDSCVKIGMGIPEGVFQFLEMADIIGQMNPLFTFSHSHPGISPYAALEQYMTQITGQGPNVNGQAMPQGVPRTPGYNQFPMGASPAMANQMLPGSPHMGSPAPGQMQAPAMQLQVSQQGTNSSGPSANTSPQQNNKKRRASQAKLEDDGPTSAPTPATIGTPQMPQMNGVQVKAKHPPTPRMQKRMKNNQG